jgi:hypothetical protein
MAPRFQNRDSVIFLALYYRGGKADDLSDLIAAYDWVNREIPTATELDGGLNRLIAAHLVVERRGKFTIPRSVLRAFNAFRRRRRRNRFVMAATFIQSCEPLVHVARRMSVRHMDWQSACANYQRKFAEALTKLSKSKPS